MNEMIMDTGFLFALMNKRDAAHTRCMRTMQSLHANVLLPVTVLPETAYLIEQRVGHRAMRAFVSRMSEAIWDIAAIEKVDLSRAHQILETYSSLNLDFVDATLIALAERLNIRTMLTLDRRHFGVVRPRHVASFELLPE